VVPESDHEREAARLAHEAANDAERRIITRIGSVMSEHGLDGTWWADEGTVRMAVKDQRRSIEKAVEP
jgi:hypothetical protein